MARTSPSGPIAVTDELRTGGLINPATMPPGPYLTIPALVFAFFPNLQPVTDPNLIQLSFINGSETRGGKIGKVRVAILAELDTAGSDPILLQWLVNGAARGAIVEIPWTPNAAPVTPAEFFAIATGTEYTFPGAEWEDGDFVMLQATLGNLVAGVNDSTLSINFEKNYT